MGFFFKVENIYISSKQQQCTLFLVYCCILVLFFVLLSCDFT